MHCSSPPVLAGLIVSLSLAATGLAGSQERTRTIDVARVWSGHPVGFCLLTHGKHQYVGFYDAERRMTIGTRQTDSTEWQFMHLPETLGWDSHNYITMTTDSEGHLHVSGNMHGVPLVYFRTSRAGDLRSLERVRQMIGRDEDRCTYPQFLRGAAGELIFTYRNGGSGRGDQFYNVYDPSSRRWRRLVEGPLVSGEGQTNAYIIGPVQDKAGMFHLCWVWRDTPDCATNHDLSYARSRDLVHWETSAGKPLRLPITISQAEIVDPVPPGGGIINGNTRIGFDAEDRPILSYHKFDAAGATQVYNARLEDGKWVIRQASDWDYRWEFSGGGTIGFEIVVGAVERSPSGALTQSWKHPRLGSGRWTLDPDTLKPVAEPARNRPAPATRPSSTRPAGDILQARTSGDVGKSHEPGVRYTLRWETLGPNRDRPREGPIPAPTMLRVLEHRD